MLTLTKNHNHKDWSVHMEILQLEYSEVDCGNKHKLSDPVICIAPVINISYENSSYFCYW